MTKKVFDRINPAKFSELLDEFNPRHEGQICACCGEFYFLDEDSKIEEEGVCEECFKGLKKL
ncbi:MAG: hypothetical protein ACOC5F_06245 [Candidatus Aminicenantaceae bacterium]